MVVDTLKIHLILSTMPTTIKISWAILFTRHYHKFVIDVNTFSHYFQSALTVSQQTYDIETTSSRRIDVVKTCPLWRIQSISFVNVYLVSNIEHAVFSVMLIKTIC